MSTQVEREERAIRSDRRYRAARDFAREIIAATHQEGITADWVAKRAVQFADALLDELDATEGPQRA